jgi:Ethylbenzene dehydrogenase
MPEEPTITRRDALVAAGTVAAVGAGAVGAAGVIGLASRSAAPAGEPRISAPFVDGGVPADDPASTVWDAAPEAVIPVQPQQIAPPILPFAGLLELRARAVHDGRTLAFRLRWDDDAVDDLDAVHRFHDAVAVMLPTAAGSPPPITMGARGVPVHILQWRATWQRDLAGKTGVDQVYPRVVHDVMPDDVLPPEEAKLYWVGRAVGNPLSAATRTTPVEQIVAEGFGTTTHLPRSDATGRGVHDGGQWTVALGFPARRDGIGTQLEPGSTWSVAFAVWLGNRDNRGGRKQYADWVPLALEPKG